MIKITQVNLGLKYCITKLFLNQLLPNNLFLQITKAINKYTETKASGTQCNACHIQCQTAPAFRTRFQAVQQKNRLVSTQSGQASPHVTAASRGETPTLTEQETEARKVRQLSHCSPAGRQGVGNDVLPGISQSPGDCFHPDSCLQSPSQHVKGTSTAPRRVRTKPELLRRPPGPPLPLPSARPFCPVARPCPALPSTPPFPCCAVCGLLSPGLERAGLQDWLGARPRAAEAQ